MMRLFARSMTSEATSALSNAFAVLAHLLQRLSGGFMNRAVSVVVAPLVLALAYTAQAQEKGGLDQTGPYQPVIGWFKPGQDRWDRPMGAVTVDRPDRIFVTTAPPRFTRPNGPMLTADGKLMEERS